VPPRWSDRLQLNDEADIQAGGLFAETYVIVLSESKLDLPGMTLMQHADLTRQGLLDSLRGGQATGPKEIPRGSSYMGRSIDWLPDRSGWLLYGHAIVDRETGQRTWTATPDPDDQRRGPRLLLPNQQMLVVVPSGRAATVQNMPLPTKAAAQ
jgi:hypothetical protein